MLPTGIAAAIALTFGLEAKPATDTGRCAALARLGVLAASAEYIGRIGGFEVVVYAMLNHPLQVLSRPYSL